MEKDRIGTILRNRIKACHYTQERFAEECGISISALKDYMRGIHAYDYEMLERFAEKLDCSYDYLLGKSDSLHPEFHEVTEQTKLSEEAIMNISKYAKEYENSFEARRYIDVLDLMLREENAFLWICDFMISSKPMDAINDMIMGLLAMAMSNASGVTTNDIMGRKIPLESTVMIHLIMALKGLKDELTPEFVAEIKRLDLPDIVDEAMAQYNAEYTE